MKITYRWEIVLILFGIRSFSCATFQSESTGKDVANKDTNPLAMEAPIPGTSSDVDQVLKELKNYFQKETERKPHVQVEDSIDNEKVPRYPTRLQDQHYLQNEGQDGHEPEIERVLSSPSTLSLLPRYEDAARSASHSGLNLSQKQLKHSDQHYKKLYQAYKQKYIDLRHNVRHPRMKADYFKVLYKYYFLTNKYFLLKRFTKGIHRLYKNSKEMLSTPEGRQKLKRIVRSYPKRLIHLQNMYFLLRKKRANQIFKLRRLQHKNVKVSKYL